MTHMTNRSWTFEPAERLKESILSGTSPARTAVILKRTMSAMKVKGRQLGTPFPIRQKSVPK